MSASIVDGEDNLPQLLKKLWQKKPKRLNERMILSLITRGSNLLEVNRLLQISNEYKAEWTATQRIVWHEEFGWGEMIQYRPCVMDAAILKNQAAQTLSGSFQRAAADALGWTVPKVLGFQLGIMHSLIENPAGETTDDYLDGMSLGFLFYESKKQREVYDETEQGSD